MTPKPMGKQLGFDAVAVTDIDLSAHEPHVKNWLARGFASDMGYLHRNLEKRLGIIETGTCRVISAHELPTTRHPTAGSIGKLSTGLCLSLRLGA